MLCQRGTKHFLLLLLLIPFILNIELPIRIVNVEETNSSLRSLKSQEVNIKLIGFIVIITDIRVGFPPQPLSLLVSMNLKNTWIIEDDLPSGFSRKRSQTYRITNENSSFKYRSEEMKGTEITDIFSIGNVQLLDYPFIAIERPDQQHDKLYNGALGLGYNYKESDLHYSFIDKAKKAQIINKSIYSFNLYHPETGVFSFGEYPKEINSKYYRTCPLVKYVNGNEPNISWQCTLDSIYLEGKYELYQARFNVIFSINSYSIMVTEKFWNYFIEKVAQKFISNHDCQIITTPFIHISCNDSFDVNQFGSISFIIGKNTYTVSPKYYFKQRSRDQICLLYHYKDYNQFVLGLPLFQEYLCVFDKETDRVGFLKYSHFIT